MLFVSLSLLVPRERRGSDELGVSGALGLDDRPWEPVLDSRCGDGSEAVSEKDAALALLDEVLRLGARCDLERVAAVVCLGSKRDLLSAGVASEPAHSAPSAASVRLERLVVWTVGSL